MVVKEHGFRSTGTDTLGKKRDQIDCVESESASDAADLMTMSSLGKRGRFGNQVFQYMFLKLCAQVNGAEVEVPQWDGKILFDLNDPTISKQLPPAVEVWESGRNMFDVIPEMIPMIERKTGFSCRRVGWNAILEPVPSCDLWGHFQIHTRHLRRYRSFIQETFTPAADLTEALTPVFQKLSGQEGPLIGVHVRRGDYAKKPRLGCAHTMPIKWWVNHITKLKERNRDAVIFICSDDLEEVLPAFQELNPVTVHDLDIKLPDRMEKMDYIVDFEILKQCQILTISNSTYSFLPSILGNKGKEFFRPVCNSSEPFVRFDPWNSEPLLFYDESPRRIVKFPLQSAQWEFTTEGTSGIPGWLWNYAAACLKLKLFRIYLGLKNGGPRGAIKSLLTGLKC